MSPVVLILVYCVLIALASLLGGWLPSLVHLTHLRKQLVISVVAGVILTVALLHMVPHAIEYLKSGMWVGGCMLCGLLVMFFLVRVFQTHPHDDATLQSHDHHHDHDHDHDHNHQHSHSRKSSHRWIGLLIGLSLHSLLDGVALAASFTAEASLVSQGANATSGSLLMGVVGLGTFLAVLLHKPLDALAITSLMQSGDAAKSERQFINVIFSLTCPCGVLLFWLVANYVDVGQSLLIGCALAFSAGLFLCIALSDLLPEVAFHSHDRGKLSAALLLGVAIAVGVELLHSHRGGEVSPTNVEPAASDTLNDSSND